MKKMLFLFLFPLSTILAQQTSTIQEESNYYRKFNFTTEAQWDSLSLAEGRTSNTRKATTQQTKGCTLNKKVYGWYPSWGGSTYKNLDWSILSDFCYFDYTVNPSTGKNVNASFAWDTSPAVTTAISKGVNVHFCATMFADHSVFLASSSAQQTFITNAINLLKTRGGNGLNIDFERLQASNKVAFKNFMTNLCKQIHAANPKYNVTLSLYAVDWNSVFDIPALNTVVDSFIILGYDFYYGGSQQAGPEAPLYNFQPSFYPSLSKSITDYLANGVSPGKLLLGLPWYGREWATQSNAVPSNTTGAFTSARQYNYVRNHSDVYSTINKKWDSNSYSTYYVYKNAGNWRQCWADDVYSYGRKFDMINQRNIGGIGIWALGYDDGYSDLWQLIKNKLSSCATVPCSDEIIDMGGPNRNYNENESYTYTIKPTGATKVTLTFSEMDLEPGADYLSVYDGVSTASRLLGTFTGTAIPATIRSSGAALTLKFISNSTGNRKGFKAKWACIGGTGTARTSEISSENISEDNVLVYPNPTTNAIMLKLTNSSDEVQKASYFLLGTTGNIVQQKEIEIQSGENIVELNLSTLTLSKGIYFVKVQQPDGEVVKKIIVQ